MSATVTKQTKGQTALMRDAVLNSSKLRAYAGMVLPGLLQIADYARLLSSRAGRFQQAHLNNTDKIIEMRLAYQQNVFERVDKGLMSLDFMVIDHIAAMGWVPADIRQKQLAHIIDLAESKKQLSIRIIHPTSEFYAWPNMLQEAVIGPNKSALYTEGYPMTITDSAEFLVGPDAKQEYADFVAVAEDLLNRAEAAALSPQDSLAWLKSL